MNATNIQLPTNTLKQELGQMLIELDNIVRNEDWSLVSEKCGEITKHANMALDSKHARANREMFAVINPYPNGRY